jgi:GT2 family glycosyltransferase
MSRPAVDVVVPFSGPAAALRELQARIERVRRRPGDTLLIVDNTPRRDGIEVAGTAQGARETIPVLRDSGRRTPGYARNRGSAVGSAEWIVFFDADTDPSDDLLDRYFEPEPGDATGLMGGGIRDEPVAPDGRPAARYQYMRAAMSQEQTFRLGPWGFPVTANVAVRRAAFEAVGGFRDDIRAGEDADLTYRLRADGWRVERREEAIVTHRSRQTLRGFVLQQALHAAGGAWLDRHYPGSTPPRSGRGINWGRVREASAGLIAAARSGDRDRMLWALFEPLEMMTWKLGRSLPNERPLRRWLAGRRSG